MTTTPVLSAEFSRGRSAGISLRLAASPLSHDDTLLSIERHQ